MKLTTERLIIRWLHILFGLQVIGYVYSPFESLPDFAWIVRYVAMPVIIISGWWMWKGHVVRQRFNKQSR